MTAEHGPSDYDLRLAEVIADMFLFLEFTGSDLINEDTAIAMMEGLFGGLLKIDGDGRARFSQAVVAVAGQHSDESRVFLKALAQDILDND